MLPWQVWLIVSGICFILEIATVGFLLFWFAIAAVITAILSLFIQNIIIQTVIFIVLSVTLIFLTKPLSEKLTKKDCTPTNSNAVVGKEAFVTKAINTSEGIIGQVKIGSGDIWSATSIDDKTTIPIGTKVKIIKIDGVKLIVEIVKEPSTISN